MAEIICKICGNKTKGENANYCMYCGSSLKMVTKKQKLLVIQEVDISPEEISRILKN